MPRVSDTFDLDSVEWRHIADPKETDFLIDFEYSLLGYDLPSGRLDMLLRFKGNGGHCRRHRHIAATVTMVLEGEQHVTEHGPDGAVTKSTVRKKGEYALAEADADPHMERGGPEGGTILLSMSAPDGRLFEYFDRDGNSIKVLTIAEYVESWNRGAVPGGVEGPEASAA
ncbi:MAG: hypothetical protein OXT06_19220 [Rhodospirillaceae bacterium]|nr:hypothetical protein [Rhodospirillaceae bacterium]